MFSPSQVLGDVYSEVLETVHPLLRGPTDHKRIHVNETTVRENYFCNCNNNTINLHSESYTVFLINLYNICSFSCLFIVV